MNMCYFDWIAAQPMPHPRKVDKKEIERRRKADKFKKMQRKHEASLNSVVTKQ